MMQRAIEEAIENQIKNKKTFVEESVKYNIDDIIKYTKGQKSLRDFIMDLNDTVDWMHMNPPSLDVKDKLKHNADLDISQSLELNNETDEKLKGASRYINMSKSSIIRMCTIKQLYNNREDLMGGNKRKIEDVWLSTVRKIKIGNRKLVDKLYYNLEEEYINKMMERPEQLLNFMNVSDAYKKFKNTEGCEYMKSSTDGQEVINILEDIVKHVENTENQMAQ